MGDKKQNHKGLRHRLGLNRSEASQRQEGSRSRFGGFLGRSRSSDNSTSSVNSPTAPAGGSTTVLAQASPGGAVPPHPPATSTASATLPTVPTESTTPVAQVDPANAIIAPTSTTSASLAVAATGASTGRIAQAEAGEVILPPPPTVSTVEPIALLAQVDPGITATNKGPSPWELAIKIAKEGLTKHGLPPLGDSPGLLAGEIIQLTVQELQAAITKENSNKSTAVGKISGILKAFDKYAKVVDTAVQHSPEITALVWAGVRATLQIALNHIEIMESLEVATAMIAEKMAICDFFGSIYVEAWRSGITQSAAPTMKSLQQSFELALPEFYAAILVFSVKARQYFNPSTSKVTKWKYMLKAFAIEFQPFIDDILEKEKRIKECAEVATMDRIKKDSNKLAQLQSVLAEVQSQLVPVVAKLVDMKTVITMTKEIHQSTSRAEVQKLLQMLTTLESRKRHQDVQSIRCQGTGTWLLQHQRYLQWRDNATAVRNRILCCYGNPGAGKTVITSIVIDDLISQFPQQDDIGIALIYCDYRDQASQTLANILGSILQQFLSVASTVPKEVKEQLESINKEGKRVDTGDLSKMLRSTLANFSYAFICIDALDELEPRVRLEFLDSLQDEFGTVGIFLTARPHVQQDVDRVLGTQLQDAIDITPDSDDIRTFLQKEITVDKRINPDTMDDSLQEETITVIVEKSKGILPRFLLPALHIRMILEKRTIAKRRKALAVLPQSLNDAYERMMRRILKSPNNEDIGKRTLLLLHLAYRPLKLTELQHALAVEPNDTDSELDEENIPSHQTLLDCCLGLVIVDEETMTVRFVHYTLEEHFKVHGSTYFPSGYSTVAQICLTYLNFGKMSTHCVTLDELNRQMTEFAFLEYAACHWGHYVRKQNDKSVTELALKLLCQKREDAPCAFQALCCLLDPYSGRKYLTQSQIWLVTNIHVAAYFGLEEYFVASVAHEQHWDPSDGYQRTPLSWAAGEGHEAVVRLLLERGEVDINFKDNGGRSPLSYAVENGHEAVVRLLLERGEVDVNSKDKYGRSPLSYAAEKGHEAMVKLLLEQGEVDINSKDKYGQSPLSYAAKKGHNTMVRLLLERNEVDINFKDNDGRSPLSYAVGNGHEAVVRLLLERGEVDVNSKDKYGRSPLSYTAEKGHEAVVRLLLERSEVDINLKDSYCQSPLLYAAKKGHEAVVRLLLERSEVDINLKDQNGWSPLSYAAENGRKDIVRLLLERSEVDVNSKDKDGRSPLSLAAGQGNKAVVTLLLERGDVDVHSKDFNYGWTPLKWATRKGRQAVVELLHKHIASLPVTS